MLHTAKTLPHNTASTRLSLLQRKEVCAFPFHSPSWSTTFLMMSQPGKQKRHLASLIEKRNNGRAKRGRESSEEGDAIHMCVTTAACQAATHPTFLTTITTMKFVAQTVVLDNSFGYQPGNLLENFGNGIWKPTKMP